MHNCIYVKLTFVFRVTCWIATVILLCYWIYFYSLDDDICLVDYKEYYGTPAHTFPILSFCLKNPFSKEILKTNNGKINPESYLNFLHGKYFSEELANMSYNNIILNMSEYINQYWIEWRNGSSESFSLSLHEKEMFKTSYSGFWRSYFYNCYSLQIPHDKSIMAFQVELRNNIFSSGILDFVTCPKSITYGWTNT